MEIHNQVKLQNNKFSFKHKLDNKSLGQWTIFWLHWANWLLCQWKVPGRLWRGELSPTERWSHEDSYIPETPGPPASACLLLDGMSKERDTRGCQQVETKEHFNFSFLHEPDHSYGRPFCSRLQKKWIGSFWNSRSVGDRHAGWVGGGRTQEQVKRKAHDGAKMIQVLSGPSQLIPGAFRQSTLISLLLHSTVRLLRRSE